MSVLRFLMAFAVLTTVGGCEAVDYPFRHQSELPALSVSNALVPIVVPSVAEAPGLSDAVIAAMESEDLVATASPQGRFQTLKAVADPKRRVIVWTLVESDGRTIGSFDVPRPPSPRDDPQWTKSAKFIAANVASLLRADAQAAPPRQRTRIALGDIVVPVNFDGASLRKALEEALKLRGYLVVSEEAAFIVGGEVKVTPIDKGRDLVQLSWLVKKGGGQQLGVVTQSNAVPHDVIQNNQASIVRPIALGAVDGVRTLIP